MAAVPRLEATGRGADGSIITGTWRRAPIATARGKVLCGRPTPGRAGRPLSAGRTAPGGSSVICMGSNL